MRERTIPRHLVNELAPDRLTRQAVAAAASDAISRLEDADTILLTSVTADSEDSWPLRSRRRAEMGPRAPDAATADEDEEARGEEN